MKKVTIYAHYPFRPGSPEDKKIRGTVPFKWMNGCGSMLGEKPNRDADWDVPIGMAAKVVKDLKALKIKMSLIVRDRKSLDEIEFKDLPGWKVS
jgi:hypothetical protein